MSQWLELEQQKQLQSLRTLAFASAAHEFRNPLNGIVQSLDLLEGQATSEMGKRYFRMARSCANLMQFLVNDILDFAQFEN